MQLRKKAMALRIVWSLLALTAATPVSAQVGTWPIDSVHSSAHFAVKHFLIATVRGTFEGPTGFASFDPKDIRTIQAEATFNMATVNSRDARRDKSLREDEGLLEVAKYPTMTFKSTKSEPIAPGHFRLTGDLTLHGVTKSVVLDCMGPTPEIMLNGIPHIGVSASTTINRKEFGITWHRLMDNGGVQMGDEVQITMDLEFLKRPAAATGQGPGRGAAPPAQPSGR